MLITQSINHPLRMQKYILDLSSKVIQLIRRSLVLKNSCTLKNYMLRTEILMLKSRRVSDLSLRKTQLTMIATRSQNKNSSTL